MQFKQIKRHSDRSISKGDIRYPWSLILIYIYIYICMILYDICILADWNLECAR